jgi:RNA polymerase sigma-70 factor (ECF subfamily)
VPLDEQDPADWDARLIRQGEGYLRRAAAFGTVGRFQLEAAIQSAHDARAVSGEVDREALLRLYAALVRIAPTLGARVGHALAASRIEGPEAALLLLGEIPGDRFQPLWAARASLLAEAGRRADARQCFDRALELTDDPAVRDHLLQRRASISD